jgi:K+-transporting ATPase ATPase A chain
MTLNGFLQLAIFFLVLLAITKPLGVYMAKVFSGEKTLAERALGPLRNRVGADLYAWPDDRQSEARVGSLFSNGGTVPGGLLRGLLL